MVLGGIVILMLYVFLSGRDVFRSGPATTPAEPRAEAVLFVGSVEVMPTKADGRAWDMGLSGLPDPSVTLINRTSKSRRQTHKVPDTLTAEFNARMATVREGDELYVRVEDIDLQVDDFIGEQRFTVTREMIDKGEWELEFGQVKRLTLRFRKPK
jgi:hypothetical protein